MFNKSYRVEHEGKVYIIKAKSIDEAIDKAYEVIGIKK